MSPNTRWSLGLETADLGGAVNIHYAKVSPGVCFCC